MKFFDRYKLDNGEIVRGKAFKIYSSIYMMSGADNQLYWTRILDHDIMDDNPFTRTVRLGGYLFHFHLLQLVFMTLLIFFVNSWTWNGFTAIQWRLDHLCDRNIYRTIALLPIFNRVKAHNFEIQKFWKVIINFLWFQLGSWKHLLHKTKWRKSNIQLCVRLKSNP